MPTTPQLAQPGDETCPCYPELKACGHYHREGKETCDECLNWVDPSLKEVKHDDIT